MGFELQHAFVDGHFCHDGNIRAQVQANTIGHEFVVVAEEHQLDPSGAIVEQKLEAR